MNVDLKLARIAYEAYSASVSIEFDPFEELPEDTRAAWVAAADAVKDEVVRPWSRNQ
jgi:hypothetical protein